VQHLARVNVGAMQTMERTSMKQTGGNIEHSLRRGGGRCAFVPRRNSARRVKWSVSIRILSNKDCVLETGFGDAHADLADVFGDILARGLEAYALRCGGDDNDEIVQTALFAGEAFHQYVKGFIARQPRKVKAKAEAAA
jgi:hypothetical protein